MPRTAKAATAAAGKFRNKNTTATASMIRPTIKADGFIEPILVLVDGLGQKPKNSIPEDFR